MGSLLRVRATTGRQGKDWMVHLNEYMPVSGMKFEGRRKDAQKVGRWFRRVEEEAELFMRECYDTVRGRAAERHAKVAAAPSTIRISVGREVG